MLDFISQYGFTILLVCLSTVFVKFGGVAIVSNTITPRVMRLGGLRRLVATRYTGILMICWVSFTLLSKALYRNFIQWATSSVVVIDKNTVEITYVVGGKMFKMVTKIPRGPRSVLMVIDENDEDVTDLVFAYTGPKGDWHGQPFTPAFFKRKSLAFEMADGRELTFEGDAVINFDNSPAKAPDTPPKKGGHEIARRVLELQQKAGLLDFGHSDEEKKAVEPISVKELTDAPDTPPKKGGHREVISDHVF